MSKKRIVMEKGNHTPRTISIIDTMKTGKKVDSTNPIACS
jgi:hypothetical protein